MWPFTRKQDTSEIVAKLNEMEVRIISAMKSEVKAKIENVEKTLISVPPEFYLIPKKVDALQQQIAAFSLIIDKLSPLQPTGQLKTIHPVLLAHVSMIQATLTALSEAHGTWLEEQTRHLKQTEEALEQTRRHLSSSLHHIALPAPV